MPHGARDQLVTTNSGIPLLVNGIVPNIAMRDGDGLGPFSLPAGSRIGASVRRGVQATCSANPAGVRAATHPGHAAATLAATSAANAMTAT